ncbi:CCR4-NOT transcription complex subunit 3, partial [Orchesella cincta]
TSIYLNLKRSNHSERKSRKLTNWLDYVPTSSITLPMVIAMAATRKLQGEIDRCLKKVSEGVETFEDIWQKVHNATNTNQKEKYETDLKKEIKKLQRLRDQIKSWIASGEIKDKSTLVDTRKLIETQMERFKVVERETKTKAYSKEGLGAAQKVDPTTREREDLNNWLVSSIDQIQIQMDQMECEIESIMAGKKKKLDKDKQERMDELKVSMERHRFHMGKLETILRMLDNLSIDINALRKFLSQVKKIKDDIEYYLESNQEPEFEENEFLYDDIEGLEEFDDGIAQQNALANLALNSTGEGGELLGETPTSNTSGNNSPVSPIHSSRDSSSDPDKRRKSSDDSSKVVRPVAMKANHSPSPGGKTVGVVGTPPKNVATPNNSSPSSGLSNHVSSLSSLSSSPTQTQNYHNALNNAKTLSHMDCVEHNNSSSTSGGLAVGGPSKSPLSKSSSTVNSNVNTSATEVTSISTANGLITENGETSVEHSSPLQQLLSSSSENSAVSAVLGENGLISSLSQEGNLAVGGGCNPLTSASSAPIGSSSITNNTDLTHHQPYTESSPGLELNSQQSNNHTPFSQQPAFGVFGTPGAVGASGLAAAGMSNTSVTSNSSLIMTTTTTTATSLAQGGVSITPGAVSNSSRDSGSLIGGNGGVLSSSHSNSSSNNILSQQQQQLQQLQMQGTGGQTGSSRDTTPNSDYMRQQDQILLNRILQEGDMASLKTMAQDVLDRTGLNLGDSNVAEHKTQDAHIPPLLGVAPLGPVPLSKEHQYQFQMLDTAHYHMPVPADAERMRQFLPRNPIPTPPYYPQHPMANADSLEFFQRLSIETLFFIFYYLEGTKAQYMAAKVLKKQSWRFHTKYMMWFQRHEEPKVINEEFEQGTYIYFDIEKWSQRKKDGFVFEYRYLEDRDLS